MARRPFLSSAPAMVPHASPRRPSSPRRRGRGPPPRQTQRATSQTEEGLQPMSAARSFSSFGLLNRDGARDREFRGLATQDRTGAARAAQEIGAPPALKAPVRAGGRFRKLRAPRRYTCRATSSSSAASRTARSSRHRAKRELISQGRALAPARMAPASRQALTTSVLGLQRGGQREAKRASATPAEERGAASRPRSSRSQSRPRTQSACPHLAAGFHPEASPRTACPCPAPRPRGGRPPRSGGRAYRSGALRPGCGSGGAAQA